MRAEMQERLHRSLPRGAEADMQVAYIGIKGLPSRAGADRVVEAIVTRLAPLGAQATVYCDRERSARSVPGVRLLPLRPLRGKHLRPLSLNLLSCLHALVFGRYDLIHLHHMEVGFLLPLLRLRYPVVSTSHGFAYRRAKWGAAARFFMRLSDYPFIHLSTAITSVSAQHARELQEKYGCQVVHIPNGTALRDPAADGGGEAIRARHGLSPGRYFILVAGRIEPTKGVHLALAAVNRLGLPLLVVGDDRQVPAYTRQLRDMAGTNVRFQGFVHDPAILTDLMSRSTCLIHPSLYEGMSMVLLEAATAGAPIVCSDIQENREVLGNAGTYFPSGDAVALAGKLEWVLANEEIAVQRARRCSLHVQERYSWDAIVPRYVEVYRQALGAGTVVPAR